MLNLIQSVENTISNFNDLSPGSNAIKISFYIVAFSSSLFINDLYNPHWQRLFDILADCIDQSYHQITIPCDNSINMDDNESRSKVGETTHVGAFCVKSSIIYYIF